MYLTNNISVNYQTNSTRCFCALLFLGEKCFYDHTFNVNQSTAIIFGNETNGIPKDVAALLDQHDKIARLYFPMSEHIRSYNLSNTVSMALSECMRQRYLAAANQPPP